MGIFDRRAPDPVLPPGPGAGHGAGSEDEQAIARYRYLLRTAPPEAIEQAHAEAFAQLTPEQRRLVLQQLADVAPDRERSAIVQSGPDPQALARAATRAELRQPGVLERLFGAGGASAGAGGPGFGSMMAGSLLGSVAGTVLGSVIAREFFDHAGHGAGLFDQRGDLMADRGDQHGLFGGSHDDSGIADDGGLSDGMDDLGGDFDSGSFDV